MLLQMCEREAGGEGGILRNFNILNVAERLTQDGLVDLLHNSNTIENTLFPLVVSKCECRARWIERQLERGAEEADAIREVVQVDVLSAGMATSHSQTREKQER